ncbi:inhibitor of apoptosis-promoting Bax1-domain-containing protein [Gilbertella persicaria]|uniref:inhibitor of apoptosis-promoting Bax1-domain-containing protein n=1 Tax=Gilbertella persicaria TaxID=101096 RepID=UPI00221EBCEC|nr:inhibitor of apoptosis-promoting Bax1-domain-containing protein [Gilbertella persicaria]KAI8084077.1 inhibitor of apoptosis-promoting Bax1-domain-containing protein [Gilbertella persicaria]
MDIYSGPISLKQIICFNSELVVSSLFFSFLFFYCYFTMSGKQDYYGSNSSSSSNALSRPVRRHLVNVYLTLAAMCAIATVGTQVGEYLGPAGSTLGSLGTIGSVSMFRFTSPNSTSRWSLLGTYSIFSGIALSTFLSFFLDWDPSGNIVFMALSSAVLIFLGFSMSAVMANRRSMLYVGGFSSTVLGVLLWLSLANTFFLRSASVFSFELYAGLLAFAGFVMYDTQMIVERASAGSRDIPGHSMELFMDLYSLFIRLAQILMKKEMDRENEKKRKRGPNRLTRDY